MGLDVVCTRNPGPHKALVGRARRESRPRDTAARSCAACDPDVLIASRRPGLLERGLDSSVTNVTVVPAARRNRLARVVGKHEHRRVEAGSARWQGCPNTQLAGRAPNCRCVLDPAASVVFVLGFREIARMRPCSAATASSMRSARWCEQPVRPRSRSRASWATATVFMVRLPSVGGVLRRERDRRAPVRRETKRQRGEGSNRACSSPCSPRPRFEKSACPAGGD